MSQEPAVLFANEAFYVAFTIRDIRSMDELWSRSLPVTCIHPGWQPLIGREAVMESWVGIFGNPGSPGVELREPRAFVYGDLAQVICYEVMEEATLVASNLFVREGSEWKLVHHQASPVAEDPAFEETDEGPRRVM